MKYYTKFILLFLGLLLFNCKKEPELIYKYKGKAALVNCTSPDKELLEEALFSFEEDLLNFYDPENRNYNQAYNRFISAYRLHKLELSSMVSEHSVEVFNTLKKNKALWNIGDKNGNLNHSLDIYKCIGEHITDQDIKETYNALINANSMSYRMIAEPLRRASYSLGKDKYLATFVALDMYYANLFDIDLKTPKDSSVIEKKPSKQTDAKDSHTAHDH